MAKQIFEGCSEGKSDFSPFLAVPPRFSAGILTSCGVGHDRIHLGDLFPAHRVAGCVVVSETMNSGLRWQVSQQFRQFHRKGCEVAIAQPAHVQLPLLGHGPELPG